MSESPTVQTIAETVDEALERLAALPPIERRAAFFAAIEALEPHSRARLELTQFGRRHLAPAPYNEAEYRAIAGLTAHRRVYSPAEADALEDHAAALRILAERKAVQGKTNAVLLLAEANFQNPPDNLRAHEAARLKLAELRELDLIAREQVEEANQYEIALRPHQSPRKRGAGRNWLRGLTAGGDRQ